MTEKSYRHGSIRAENPTSPNRLKLQGVNYLHSHRLEINFEEILNLSNPVAVVVAETSSKLRCTWGRSVNTERFQCVPPPAKFLKKPKQGEAQGVMERENTSAKTNKKKTWPNVPLEKNYELLANSVDSDAIAESVLTPPMPRSTKRKTHLCAEQKEFLVITKNSPLDKPTEVLLSKPVTIAELSGLLVLPASDIIKHLFLKGFSATINQEIDVTTARLIGEEFGIQVTVEAKSKLIEVERPSVAQELLEGTQEPKVPVIVILGDLQHGKTTFLNWVCNSNNSRDRRVAWKSTQKLEPREIEIPFRHEMKRVVFLDMPGHKTFSTMWSRVLSIADVIIFIIASDEGVQSQTLEILHFAQSANLPIVVAINKIDKKNSNPDRIQQELLRSNLIPEAYGGVVATVPISSLDGTNIHTLLERALSLFEIKSPKILRDSFAKGVVLESYMDRTKGFGAMLIVQHGTLKMGDTLVVGSLTCKAKFMVNLEGKPAREAVPSIPMYIWGLPEILPLGEHFQCVNRAPRASLVKHTSVSSSRCFDGVFDDSSAGAEKKVSLIIKVDAQGSAEAIVNAIGSCSTLKACFRISHVSVGEITETDLKLALTHNSTLIAFNTSVVTGVKKTVKSLALTIKEFESISDLISYLESVCSLFAEPDTEKVFVGNAVVKSVFPISKGYVAGSLVTKGKLFKASSVEVLREDKCIYSGLITSLRILKEDVEEIIHGTECGIFINDFCAWKPGDIVAAFDLVEK